MKKSIVFFFLFLTLAADVCLGIVLEQQQLSVNGYDITLQVPEDMRVEFVAPLSRPRFIARGPDNEFIIGSRSSSIYRFKYPYSQAETLVQLSGFPHSAVYRMGKLYVAETQAVWSAAYTGQASSLDSSDFTKVVQLPSATGGHSSRTIITGPDNRLYIGLGISGNCSDEYLDNSYPFEKRRGGVFALDPGGTLQPYSAGLRNPIGLAFHPQTNVLYAANAGPDHLGYDRPPEVFAALLPNSFHGMPWFAYYDGSFKDAGCASSSPPRPIGDATAPSAVFDARSTPEGIAFLTSSSLGAANSGNAAVAIHGSWAVQPGQGSESRRSPQLSMVVFQQQNPVRVEDLVTGFQRADGSRFARPCGVIVGADGHLYFTSDGGEVTGLFRLIPTTKSVTRPVTSVLGILLDQK